jgi:hypothetical protein
VESHTAAPKPRGQGPDGAQKFWPTVSSVRDFGVGGVLWPPKSQGNLRLSYKQNPTSRISRSWAMVAHTCNLNYSGGRDQEDQGSKPALAAVSRDPILKIPITKQDWRSGSSGRASA